MIEEGATRIGTSSGIEIIEGVISYKLYWYWLDNRNIWWITSIIDTFLSCFINFPFSGQVDQLLCQGEWGIVSTYSCNRGFQMKETVLLQFSTYLTSHSNCLWGLMSNNASPCLFNWINQGLCIIGVDCLKVNNLCRNAFFF